MPLMRIIFILPVLSSMTIHSRMTLHILTRAWREWSFNVEFVYPRIYFMWWSVHYPYILMWWYVIFTMPVIFKWYPSLCEMVMSILTSFTKKIFSIFTKFSLFVFDLGPGNIWTLQSLSFWTPDLSAGSYKIAPVVGWLVGYLVGWLISKITQ